ncbi:hypothetical protein QCA50_007629 [Cerrena zonata]|uniref:F-box domain-containing protein n=1 Tax=Cerrena zonata TaxID=2478898 RepID=A0AAW0GFQ1_9APHY
MLSKIPQELIDYIIDFLHNDKETLVHCALTHTTWTNTSRYHLFSSILITVRVEAPSSNGYIIPFSSIGDPEHHLERNDNRHDIEKVLQFFKQERYSHCRHYVRHILIRGIVHRGQCTLEVSKIGQILTLLRSVKSLSILSLKLYPLTEEPCG